MTEQRYESDHDGERAYVFDKTTGLRAYFPDSAAAYKAAQWLEQGISRPSHYRWQAGRNSVYIDVQNGSWGNAADVVIVDVTDVELQLLEGSSDSEIAAFGHEKHHAQLQDVVHRGPGPVA